jgi:hypothetical protein
MRRRWIRTGILAGLAAVLGLGAAVPAALADERDFTLVNDSSRAIVDLYITHVSEPGWSDNILGEDSLDAGGQVQVLFADPDPGFCNYSVKVITETGETAIVDGVNLCETNIVAFQE